MKANPRTDNFRAVVNNEANIVDYPHCSYNCLSAQDPVYKKKNRTSDLQRFKKEL